MVLGVTLINYHLHESFLVFWQLYITAYTAYANDHFSHLYTRGVVQNQGQLFFSFFFYRVGKTRNKTVTLQGFEKDWAG
jgi:chloramphenicol O-acetyltransferase